MKMRLTTDDPQGNFSTMVNYVFSKDGLAYIRSDGESDEPVLLTDWANRRCIQHRCISKSHSVDTFKEIDGRICDCAFANPQCPVFLAYTFAYQAVHMRDRCKAYEDAEEQGLLVKLPCKVGDTVYVSRKNSVLEEKVEGYNQSGVDVTYECDYDCEGCPHFSPYTNYEAGDGGCDGEYGVSTHKFEDFGKAVFLTHDAAEAALKEMEADNGTD